MAAEPGRTIADIIATGFSLLFRHPMLFLATALPQIMIVLMGTALGPRAPVRWGYQYSFSAAGSLDSAPHLRLTPYASMTPHLPPGVIALAATVGLLIGLLFLWVILLQYAATAAVVADLTGGRKVDLLGAYLRAPGGASGLLWPHILCFLIMTAGPLLSAVFMAAGKALGAPHLTGFLGVAVAGIWILCVGLRFVFIFPAVVIEGRRGFAALSRSGEIWEEGWGRTLGVLVGLLALVIVTQIGIVVIGGLVSTIAADPVLGPSRWITGSFQVLQAWFGQIGLITVMVLYGDLISARPAPRATWIPIAT